MSEFEALGKKVTTPSTKLETFEKPKHIAMVELETDEVTSLCPVTGQPDWDKVIVRYIPNKLCIESKSFKLYTWSFREKGTFCETLAETILEDVWKAAEPHWCEVLIRQKPRGGVSIEASAIRGD